MIRTGSRRFPVLFAAIAALAVAGTVLALLFSEVDAHSPDDGSHGPEHTHFYLWSTTMTVGEESGYLGYDSDTDNRLGSISTDANFNYPPWSPPGKHHFDPDYEFTVAALYIDPSGEKDRLILSIPDADEANKIFAGKPRIWIGNMSFRLIALGGDTVSFGFIDPDLDWKEDDEVRVVLYYERALPSAPENVSVTAPRDEDGTLEVSWDAADDGTFPIECYLVEFLHPSGEPNRNKQSYPGSRGAGKGCGDSPPTSVKRTDLEAQIRYEVRVQALSGDGYGDWSETKRAPRTSSDRSDDSSGQKKQSEEPVSAPDKPTGLEATATHDSVTLTWDDPGDDSITGYVILRRIPGVDPEGHFDELVANTDTDATTYTDDTVSAETRYTYRIKAINGAGTSERSRWSHIDTPAAPVPDQPTGLEATESDGQVVLTWDDPGDDSITGYVILRRVRVNDQGGDFSVLVADTGSAATTYTDGTVAASTTYTYRIKAINEHGASERSRWYHIDTPAEPPSRPTGLESAASSDLVLLSWADPQDDSVTGYRILRADVVDGVQGEFAVLIEDTGTAETSYADDTVEDGRVYVYRVLAIGPGGVSEPSQDVRVRTTEPVAPPNGCAACPARAPRSPARASPSLRETTFPSTAQPPAGWKWAGRSRATSTAIET